MAEPVRDVRYTAFLSYSHKDAAAAGRLHRRLESYRMPKRLVGTDGARGPVPERLSPIFRDREELPAATDLSETVREALGQSGALIILCSPHAAGSLWVAEEIETFRTLHPDRPILAAILAGDPPDCFPAALRAFGRDGTWHEPLATDLRPGKDGKQLGLLKLVAGITGVGLDALVQRDAARRIRRVTILSALALIGTLVMAALAVLAFEARREAERQRAASEGLVEFMLTDLRASLRGVGRLDIMSVVNRRALTFYSDQRAAANRPADAAMQARVRHAIGEDDLDRGNERVARANFDAAHRATSALIRRWPNDPNVIFAHAQSEYWVGRVHELHGEWAQAERLYGGYAAAAQRLISLVPDNPEYMKEVAFAAEAMGNTRLYGDHDPVAAETLFRRAIGWFEATLRARPGDDDARIALANAYANLADSFHMRTRWAEALGFRLRQYEIVAQLRRADPGNVRKLYRLAAAERSIAGASERTGDLGAVRRFRARSHQSALRLTTLDPDNAEWLVFRTIVECDLLKRPPPLPANLSEAGLRESIRAAVARLTAQRDPRISLIYCRALPSVRRAQARAGGG